MCVGRLYDHSLFNRFQVSVDRDLLRFAQADN